MALAEIAKVYGQKERGTGQIAYIGVSSSERPGKSLKNSELACVVLDYLMPGDWELIKNVDDLRWERIQRFTTQAYAQGAALTLADTAYVTAVSVDAVQRALKKHPGVVLPTRGRTADMGPTLSHAEKILNLFMYGYTETEISRRTGHSLDSIERYLIDFSKVVLLADQGLPTPAIRQATGFSIRLTEKYVALYKQYDIPDFQFAMARIRRLGQTQRQDQRQPREKDDAKDDGG